jgi:hypothetical protein
MNRFVGYQGDGRGIEEVKRILVVILIRKLVNRAIYKKGCHFDDSAVAPVVAR